MSGVEGVVTEVLREHRRDFETCVGCGQMNATQAGHEGHVAAAVVQALGLTEEWAVQDKGGVLGKWHRTREAAEKHCRTIVGNFWTVHRNVSGACIAEPHPEPVRRWVSPWVAVERGEQ